MPRYLLIGASTGGPRAVAKVLADIDEGLQRPDRSLVRPAHAAALHRLLRRAGLGASISVPTPRAL